MLTKCAYRRCQNRLVALTLKVRLTNDWWGKFLSDFYAYYINRLYYFLEDMNLWARDVVFPKYLAFIL